MLHGYKVINIVKNAISWQLSPGWIKYRNYVTKSETDPPGLVIVSGAKKLRHRGAKGDDSSREMLDHYSVGRLLPLFPKTYTSNGSVAISAFNISKFTCINEVKNTKSGQFCWQFLRQLKVTGWTGNSGVHILEWWKSHTDRPARRRIDEVGPVASLL